MKQQYSYRTLLETVLNFKNFKTKIGDTVEYKLTFDWENSLISAKLVCKGEEEELIYEILDLVETGHDFKEIERIGIPEKNGVGVVEYLTIQQYARDVLSNRLKYRIFHKGYNFEESATKLSSPKSDSPELKKRLESNIPFQPEQTIPADYDKALARIIDKNVPKIKYKRKPE